MIKELKKKFLKFFQIEKLLKDGGATCCNYFVTSTTHLLCGTNFDESDIAQAADLYEIPSITEDWVIATAKLGRFATTKPYDPVPTRIFSQIFAAITRVSADDRKKLYALITFNGGIVERNFTASTTHLICGVASGAAYEKSLTVKNDNFSVVSPDWVIDCLKNREQLDPQSYHPKLLIVTEPTWIQKSLTTSTVPSSSSLSSSSSSSSTTTTTTTAMLTDSVNIDNVDKQSLASILGLDFEESIAKTEVPIGKNNEILGPNVVSN